MYAYQWYHGVHQGKVKVLQLLHVPQESCFRVVPGSGENDTESCTKYTQSCKLYYCMYISGTTIKVFMKLSTFTDQTIVMGKGLHGHALYYR